jgi:hypothetical protein
VDNTFKHSSLLSPEDDVPSETDASMNRFTLDTVIEDEGGNLSIGQVSEMEYLSSLSNYFLRSVRWCLWPVP